MCVSTVPTSGFCTSPGACSFQAPTIQACDTGATYDFYGGEYCSAAATVITVSAGWCGPCQEEAPIVESQITAAYRARGVRVVSVLIETASHTPATTSFCQSWQSRYRLTSRMVVDPSDSISRRLRVSGYPFMAVIDGHGVIRLADAAVSTSRIRSTLDAILAGR